MNDCLFRSYALSLFAKRVFYYGLPFAIILHNPILKMVHLVFAQNTSRNFAKPKEQNFPNAQPRPANNFVHLPIFDKSIKQ
jgi:hypothetical protein